MPYSPRVAQVTEPVLSNQNAGYGILKVRS
jgi:hypothetical protein